MPAGQDVQPDGRRDRGCRGAAGHRATANSRHGSPPAPATSEAVPAPPANVTTTTSMIRFRLTAPGSKWTVWPLLQPSVVVLQSGWRPYCQGGRWIYSDYGWYWHSDYSWGWAPFHYGRWFSHPRWGWCWRPDTIWGPSWVSWRYTDAYCGWAPLPPAAFYSPGFGFSYYGSSVGVSFGFGLGWDCYSFVSWGHFRDHRPYRHCAPPHLAHDLHRNSTVVNHFEVGRNRTIINRGIAPDRVSRFTKTELRPVHVREEGLAGRSSRLTPGDRLERGGRELVIRRPQMPQISAPPVAVKSGRAEPRTTSAASFSDRRAAFEPAQPHRREKSHLAPGISQRPDSHKIRQSQLKHTSVAARSSSPTAPTGVAAPTARPVTPSRSTVTTIGRRQTTPAHPSTPVLLLPRSGPGPTHDDLDQALEPSAERGCEQCTVHPVPTQRSIQSTPWPTIKAPATVAPRTYTAPAPSPSVRSEPRWSAPAPSAPPAFSRPSSPPTYSPPVTRSAPRAEVILHGPRRRRRPLRLRPEVHPRPQARPVRAVDVPMAAVAKRPR